MKLLKFTLRIRIFIKNKTAFTATNNIGYMLFSYILACEDLLINYPHARLEFFNMHTLITYV